MFTTAFRMVCVGVISCVLIQPGYAAGKVFHDATQWKLETSVAFDTLCALNVLTGDPYYLRYYRADYDRLSPKLTPEARSALADLKHQVKDEHKQIISAFLTLYFSATKDQTLDDMLATVEHSEEMKRNLKSTPYYSESGWQLYEGVRGDLGIIFRELRKMGFDQDWEHNILPKEQQRIGQINEELANYNLVPRIEKLLGSPMASSEITVYMLYYAQPHGIKIAGTRFLTDVAWPFRVVVRNAAHEMMHPPFDLQNDHELRRAVDLLEDDPFVKEKFRGHDASFGYNSLDGLIEEDCVQALEQLVNEDLGIAVDPRQRWKENDDGLHVFAAALYSVMRRESFASGTATFPEFLTRVIRCGRLTSGTVRKEYDTFYKVAPATVSNQQIERGAGATTASRALGTGHSPVPNAR